MSFKEKVLDSLNEPIYAIDSEKNIKLWNQSISNLTGISASEVLDQPVYSKLAFKNFDFDKAYDKAKPVWEVVEIGNKTYRTFLEPILSDASLIGYTGSLYNLKDGILDVLPREYLIEIINASPTSTLVFNPDGSIMFSNNAYRKMWSLSEEELIGLNKQYNIFLDTQIEKELIDKLKLAFKGSTQQSKPFKYALNTNYLGRDEEVVNWLMANAYPIFNDKRQVSFVVVCFTDITDQYKLEKAYYESKDRLQLAMEGGNLGMWYWDLITEELVYNDCWADMLGYKIEEVYDIKWENLLHPEDSDRVTEALNRLVTGADVEYEQEYRLKTKDGKWKWILDRGKTVKRDIDGKPVRLAGTHIDINDKKIVEERVRKSEEQYRRLIDYAPIGILIVVEEKIAFGNIEFVRMAEANSQDEIVGLPVRNIIPSEEKYNLFLDRQKMVLELGENAPLISTQLKTVKNNIIEVDTVIIPTLYQEKEAMQIIIRNITDKVKAQLDLARSENLLQQIFNNSPMGIVLLDDKHNVSDVNIGFEKIFGYTIDEIRGKPLVDYIIPDEKTDEALLLNKSVIKGEKNTRETYRKNKKGEIIPVILYALPLIVNGKNIGVYAIYIDIRERVEIEEELRIRNMELDNFVYKVSHDIRAPMASILGLINLTKMIEDEKEKAAYLELMEKQVNKLDFFIRDILSHSKNLKMTVKPEQIDFTKITNLCFEDLNYHENSKLIEKRIDIKSGEFYSDKYRIGEVFRNLISNAIKYMDSGKDTSYIEVKVSADKNGCKISIKDNGIGIHKDVLPHITEMFYRGTEASDGSGIGLYIVQKAVKKMKGNISIDSVHKEWTNFEIWLPSLRNLTKE